MMPPVDPSQISSTAQFLFTGVGVLLGNFILTVWNGSRTAKKVEAKGEDVKKNTPTPDQIGALAGGIKDLVDRVTTLEVVSRKNSDASQRQSLEFTQSLNVFAAELSAQRAAFRKLDPRTVPEISASGLKVEDFPPQPNGKVIRKP